MTFEGSVRYHFWQPFKGLWKEGQTKHPKIPQNRPTNSQNPTYFLPNPTKILKHVPTNSAPLPPKPQNPPTIPPNSPQNPPNIHQNQRLTKPREFVWFGCIYIKYNKATTKEQDASQKALGIPPGLAAIIPNKATKQMHFTKAWEFLCFGCIHTK